MEKIDLKKFVKDYNIPGKNHRINKRGQLEYERANGTLAVASINLEPSMTQQQYRDECDINHLMDRYMKTGELPVHRKTGYFIDVSETPESYHAAMDLVLQADDAFNLLPAQTRARFQNDPAQLLGFLNDPKNKDEAQKLGLIPSKDPSHQEQMLDLMKLQMQKNDDKNSKPNDDKK